MGLQLQRWLDAGEWESLRQRNFHDEIHFIFTEPWQRKIVREEVNASAQLRLEERLGQDLFSRISSLKAELSAHPHRTEALAFLTRE